MFDAIAHKVAAPAPDSRRRARYRSCFEQSEGSGVKMAPEPSVWPQSRRKEAFVRHTHGAHARRTPRRVPLRHYRRSAMSRTSRSVPSQPMQASVMDCPYTPPPTGWLPSTR